MERSLTTLGNAWPSRYVCSTFYFIAQRVLNAMRTQAFSHTAAYDTSISNYFRKEYLSADKLAQVPADQKADLVSKVQQLTLRYGANPHQKPAQAYVTEGNLPFHGTLLVSHHWCPR